MTQLTPLARQPLTGGPKASGWRLGGLGGAGGRSGRQATIAGQALKADPVAEDGCFRKLVQNAQTNHIRLVLAPFSMAANCRSDPEIVKLYQAGYPLAPWQIQANIVDCTIVPQLAGQHPQVCLMDTRPRLDGEHDKFIDLVHFAPAGDQQLAENSFNALRSILPEDLSRL